MKKIRIIPHDKKDKAKARILQAIMDNWTKEYPAFEEDVQKLATELVIFNMKYGTKLNPEKLYEKN